MNEALRFLEGSLTSIPGVADPSVDSISISLNVNQVPAATVTFHEAYTPVKTAISEEVINTMRIMQESMFRNRKLPDFEVSMVDGKGGSLPLTGYLTAPVSQARHGMVNQRASLVCSDTIVDALDLSIYDAVTTVTSHLKIKQKYDDFVPVDAMRDGDLAKHILDILEKLEGNFQSLQNGRTEPDKQVNLILHETNTAPGGPLETFREILKNSEVVFDSWEEAFKVSSLSYDVTERIINILRQGAPGFWGNIRALLSEFRLLYIPNTSGAGKFIRADNVAFGPTKSIKLELSQESLGAGSKRILPLGGVVIKGKQRMSVAGAGGTGENNDNKNVTVKPMSVAQFPEVIDSGWLHQMRAPIWLDTPVRKLYKPKADAATVLKKFTEDAARNISLNIPQMIQRMSKSMATALANEEIVRGKVLYEFAELVYHELKLADSTATLEIPMDLTLLPGQRLDISSEKVRIGVGFISRVTHNMAVNTNNLSATTTLSLTHMDYSQP